MERSLDVEPDAEPREAVLLIGPAFYWKQLVEEIRALHLVPVACIAEDFKGSKLEKFVPFDQIRADSEHGGFEVLLEGKDPYRILELAAHVAHAKRLRFVACFHSNEPDTAVADFVAAGLGLRHNLLNLTLARRDKGAMKEALRAAGLPHTPFARVRWQCGVFAAVAAFTREHGLPVVVKTPACASSADVVVCRDEERAQEVVADLTTRPSPWGHQPAAILLEKYIDGQEYAVNLMATPDAVHATDMWQYDRAEAPSGAVLYRQVASVDVTSPELSPLVEYAKGVCRAVGIVHGPAHVEVKASPAGPMLVEVGARFSGGRKPELAALMVPGWNPFRAMVETYVGWAPKDRPLAFPPSFAPQKHATHLFFPAVEAGEVTAVHGVDEIRVLESYHSHLIMCQVGERVEESTDIVSVPFFVWLLHEDPTALERDAARARELFRLVVKAGESDADA